VSLGEDAMCHSMKMPCVTLIWHIWTRICKENECHMSSQVVQVPHVGRRLIEVLSVGPTEGEYPWGSAINSWLLDPRVDRYPPSIWVKGVNRPQPAGESCDLVMLGISMPGSHVLQCGSRQVVACDRAMYPRCQLMSDRVSWVYRRCK
jgi:hypothetical protein